MWLIEMIYWFNVLILVLIITAIALLTWKLRQLTRFCNAIAEGFSIVQDPDFCQYE